MKLTVTQAIEKMNQDAAEVKMLFADDSTARDGSRHHDNIDERLAYHTNYIQQRMVNVDATFGRFTSDMDAFRRIAARAAAKAAKA